MFGWLGLSRPTFCENEFKDIWSGFVDAVTDSAHAHGPAAAPPRPPNAPPARHSWSFPAAKRLVAVGDLHGDYLKMATVLKAANLVDEEMKWTGGDAVLVQVGDLLDRGDDEVALLYTLERLQREAARAGGAVHILNGNHETMNVQSDFRYVTDAGNKGFKRWQEAQQLAAALKLKCGCADVGWSATTERSGVNGMPDLPRKSHSDDVLDARGIALNPGGTIARRFLAEHPMAIKVGQSVFVHGGLHTDHIRLGMDHINAAAQDWMEGGGKAPRFVRGPSALVWSRAYSHEQRSLCKCDMLRDALSALDAQRMVVGHTIQEVGVNAACEGRVVRCVS